MTSTMIRVRSARNPARKENSASGNPVQVGTGRHISAEHGEIRGRYDIEADMTIGAILVAFFAAGAAFGGMLVLGVVRTLGAR